MPDSLTIVTNRQDDMPASPQIFEAGSKIFPPLDLEKVQQNLTTQRRSITSEGSVTSEEGSFAGSHTPPSRSSRGTSPERNHLEPSNDFGTRTPLAMTTAPFSPTPPHPNHVTESKEKIFDQDSSDPKYDINFYGQHYPSDAKPLLANQELNRLLADLKGVVSSQQQPPTSLALSLDNYSSITDLPTEIFNLVPNLVGLLLVDGSQLAEIDFSACSKLKKLQIDNVNQLDPKKGLKTLRNCPALEELSLKMRGHDQLYLGQLLNSLGPQISTLQSLTIENISGGVTNHFLKTLLSQAPNLKKLVINATALPKHLDLKSASLQEFNIDNVSLPTRDKLRIFNGRSLTKLHKLRIRTYKPLGELNGILEHPQLEILQLYNKLYAFQQSHPHSQPEPLWSRFKQKISTLGTRFFTWLAKEPHEEPATKRTIEFRSYHFRVPHPLTMANLYNHLAKLTIWGKLAALGTRLRDWWQEKFPTPTTSKSTVAVIPPKLKIVHPSTISDPLQRLKKSYTVYTANEESTYDVVFVPSPKEASSAKEKQD